MQADFATASAGLGFMSALMVLAGLGGLHYSPIVMKEIARQSLRRRCRRERVLALTYDDGPSSRLTPEVLDLLDEHGVRATFFLIGRSVVGQEPLVRRIAAAGHELGCHSMEHLHAWRAAPWRVVADIVSGYQRLAPWVPEDGLFRPPYGKIILSSWLHLLARNAPVAWWTHDSGDTHRRLPPDDLLADRVGRDGGGVVLLHDSDRPDPAHRKFVLNATRSLLRRARVEGFRVELVGSLLRNDRKAC